MHAFIADILRTPLAMKPAYLPVAATLEPMPHRQARAASMCDADLSDLYVTRDGGLAVVRVDGMIAYRCGVMGWLFGACDSEALAGAINDLADDPKVHTVVLDLETPGGTVKGTDAVLAALDAVVAAGKRLVGVVAGECYSAGLWILSRCPERVVAPLACVGSLGAMTVMEDSSERDRRDGYRTILIASTELKGSGWPGVEITEVQIAAEESIVMAMHAAFVADVADGCGVDTDTVEGWARSPDFFGSQAVEAGLATRVGLLVDVLTEINTGATA